MKKGKIYVGIFLILVIVLVYGIVAWNSGPGDYDEFAQCLSEKGVKMYGTDWCHFCQEQKRKFGRSFEYVDYVNCDTNKQECNQEGITGYPTWEVEGKKYSGVQPLEHLSTLSGCELK